MRSDPNSTLDAKSVQHENPIVESTHAQVEVKLAQLMAKCRFLYDLKQQTEQTEQTEQTKQTSEVNRLKRDIAKMDSTINLLNNLMAQLDILITSIHGEELRMQQIEHTSKANELKRKIAKLQSTVDRLKDEAARKRLEMAIVKTETQDEMAIAKTDGQA
jgi:ribosomal protein L29